MVERQSVLDRAFGALADPTRRAILTRLRRGSATVSEVAAPFEMSLYGVSKHVRVLERAGLVRREVHGREHHLHLETAPLAKAAAFTDRYRAFWEARIDALAQHVEAGQRGRQKKKRAAGKKGSAA
jgi:DNA-binding transcriptional ArsR family regulator